MARIVQSTAFPQVIPSAVPRVCGGARKSPSSQGVSFARVSAASAVP